MKIYAGRLQSGERVLMAAASIGQFRSTVPDLDTSLWYGQTGGNWREREAAFARAGTPLVKHGNQWRPAGETENSQDPAQQR